MLFTLITPHGDLYAAAYILEIILGMALFLGTFRKRDHFVLRTVILCLVLIVLGTVTGIPAVAGFPRFLWFFIAMAACIVASGLCLRVDLFTLTSACVAGFAAQHIANKFTILLGMIPAVSWIASRSVAMRILFEMIVFGYVYLIIFLLFGRHQTNARSDIRLHILSAVIVIICIGVNRLVVDNAEGNSFFQIAACLYAIVCCIFALIIQFTVGKWQQADMEKVLTEQLFAESKKQYEQWSANAGMIRGWIHDLRHLMERVENLATEKHVDIPDISAVRKAVDRISPATRTCNDALDVLLVNMDDLCRKHGITMQCVAYSDCLKHFDGMRLYFLFANAIDNAIESVSKIEDPEKRLIDISIRTFGDSAAIHFWNYYSGTISFEAGLPVSDKDKELHGFGMKSMQRIVDEFGGVMSAHTEGEVFNLDIMLPIVQ